MTKRSGNKKGKAGGSSTSSGYGASGFMEDLRQRAYPREWRIDQASGLILVPKLQSGSKPDQARSRKPVREERQPGVSPTALAEVATCLWYLKTKHFKREWHNDDTADDDPRVRRTLGRLNKGADALKKCGIEVVDPTGKRYPSGGEAMMRPLDFVPTQGLTFDKVTEAVMPMVYWNGQLVQRAEVFVAVPKTEEPAPAAVAGSGSHEGSAGHVDSANKGPDTERTGEQA